MPNCKDGVLTVSDGRKMPCKVCEALSARDKKPIMDLNEAKVLREELQPIHKKHFMQDTVHTRLFGGDFRVQKAIK